METIPPSEKKHRSKWSFEEDEALRQVMVEELPWKIVSDKMTERGFQRDAKQCRDRWKNYLSNEYVNNVWREEEDKILLLAFQRYGPKWTTIAQIPLFRTRTQNQLKNRYYHSIKNRTEYLSTSIVLHESRPKGRPTSEPSDHDKHRSQTVIPFERNPQNLLNPTQVLTVIPFERI
ncbi:Myb-like DNA-binding domain containing protein [Tritrichomonas foetus]|uniref:Myb-like DNA-binding domain containing protein n=1 Tax=Tritrichomonas foetus TaxID=1144522 RepID=A0A1J4KGL3_9EUKA|nr:Myb-like DNA-binding domain containing protein [Tritrichomonas foetus]|eukprot:OHT08940.1 Myb-like DNA-binding domain containing protein [Tritrichomonas foetus]